VAGYSGSEPVVHDDQLSGHAFAKATIEPVLVSASRYWRDIPGYLANSESIDTRALSPVKREVLTLWKLAIDLRAGRANPTEMERDMFVAMSYSLISSESALQLAPYVRSSYRKLDCDRSARSERPPTRFGLL